MENFCHKTKNVVTSISLAVVTIQPVVRRHMWTQVVSSLSVKDLYLIVFVCLHFIST